MSSPLVSLCFISTVATQALDGVTGSSPAVAFGKVPLRMVSAQKSPTDSATKA